MKSASRALYALLIVGALTTPARAQEPDAFVPPPGVLRLHAGALYTVSDSRFVDGIREPLASVLTFPPTGSTFFPLRPLETELNRFFAETGNGSVMAGPENLTLGTSDLAISTAVRAFPFGVEVEVLPRVSLGVTVPVLREEVAVTRFALSGGTVGLNPDAIGNRQLLAALPGDWAALGGAVLLPTDSSVLGRELQERVRALTGGEELQLPSSALDAAALNQLLVEEVGVAPIGSELRPWQVGDAEVAARVQLLNDLNGPYPEDTAGVHFRAALYLGARLPTGTAPDPHRLLSFAPVGGQTGLIAGVDGDLFFARRFWATLSTRYAHPFRTEVERRVISPEEPFSASASPRAIQWTPGNELSLRMIPRYRLTEEIALGLQYAFLRVGEGTYEVDTSGATDEAVAGILGTPAQTAQMLGGRIRFSTLPAASAGEADLPFEVTLSYQTTFAGSSPAGSSLLVEASVFPRLWGR